MMRSKVKAIIRWGALWHCKCKLDGVTEHICFEHCLPALFIRKGDAQEWIRKHYGYIAKRKDLRAEPFGWRMPKPVRVSIALRKGGG